MKYFDEAKVRQAISVLVIPGSVFEVRIIRKRPPAAFSGYFKNADDLLKELARQDLNNTNVYITLNAVNESCAAMEQSGKFLKGASATKDDDIDYHSWLFIDLDPKRKSGISSSKEELEKAFQMATKIYNFFREHNFPEPVKAISGNGAHLLYKIALANNDENKQMLQNCLKALDLMFSNEDVEVDVTTATPSHTIKLYGTLAQKGADTQERPHRMSRIVYVPDNLQVTDKAKLEWLAAQLPKTEEPRQSKPYVQGPGSFDLENWMRAHGIGYKQVPWRDGAKYVLDVCPFNSEHKAPDSCVFQRTGGAIGFKCFHNSCAGRTWRDVRLMYEPDAYTKTERSDWQIETSWTRCTNANREPVKLNIAKPAENEPVFLTAQDIVSRHEPEAEYLATGIPGIDYNMKGLAKGSVSCLSGLRASAKSTLLSQLMLMMIKQSSHTAGNYPQRIL